MTNQYAQVSQVLALIVGDTPPGPLEISASVVEYLYEVGTPEEELQLAQSVIEFLALMAPPTLATPPIDPIAMGFVAGPRWQMSGRPVGGGS